MTCDKCGFESDDPAWLKTEKEPFSKQRTLCVACRGTKEESIYRFIWWAYVGLGLVGIALTLLFPREVYGGWVMNAGFVLVISIVSTIFHESGHAIAAKLVGFRVFAIDLGFGTNVLEFKIGGLRWRLRAVPFGGLMSAAARNARGFKLKYTAVVLAGPLTNAVLAIVSFSLLDWDSTLEGTRFWEFWPAHIALLVNAMKVLYSLWPHEFKSGGRKLANDGLLVWRTWRKKAPLAKEIQASYCAYEASECMRGPKFEDAQQWIEKGLQADPENLLLKLSAGTILSFQNRFEEARNGYVDLIAKTPNDSKLLPTIKNNLAFVNALLDRPELLEEADRLSAEALKTKPTYSYYQGTRGFVLAQLGRYAEGTKLLQEALKQHTEKSSKAIIVCCLGIAAAKQGQESGKYYALARKFDPHCRLLEWESKILRAQAMR
jgi:tetratricopeptide (TPR) repeat protein